MKDTILSLNKLGDAFDAVGNLSRNDREFKTASLLEIGELSDFEPIQKDLPPKTGSAERPILPVIFEKSQIVIPEINSNLLYAVNVAVLDIVWSGFEQNLVLKVTSKTIWIVTISTVRWTATRLHVSNLPWLRTQSTKKRRRMHSSSADFHIVGLLNNATILCPELL